MINEFKNELDIGYMHQCNVSELSWMPFDWHLWMDGWIGGNLIVTKKSNKLIEWNRS